MDISERHVVLKGLINFAPRDKQFNQFGPDLHVHGGQAEYPLVDVNCLLGVTTDLEYIRDDKILGYGLFNMVLLQQNLSQPNVKR